MTPLHPTKTVQAVQPRYVKEFSCAGAQCEDNCCTGWTVHLDKKTFTAYRQAQSTPLSGRFETQLKRLRRLNSDVQYARIEMQPETQACPFMEDRLCGIQREMGEDKLSDTCATYPRNHRVMAGQHELSLTLSCPQAARLALLRADAMDFVESTIHVRPAVVHEKRSKQGLSIDAMGSVRVLVLQIMRTPGLQLWEKLAVLGVFCEQLTSTLKAGGHARIPELVDGLSQMVQTGAMVEALAQMEPDHSIQALVFSSLWRLKIKRKLSPVQHSVQLAVSLGLGADPLTHQVSEQKLIEHYRAGVLRLPLALKEVPYLLENYLINEMFNEVFPFGDTSPDDHFRKLVTRFGLLRLMLAAQCNAETMPSPEQMARTVQVFCRQYQHDASFAGLVNSALKNAKWDSLEKIFRFLRS